MPTRETQAAIDDFFAPYPYPLPNNDFFYWAAGNFFRQYSQYDDAIRVYEAWRTELEHTKANAERRAEITSLLGEAYFLSGEYDKALLAFEHAARLRPDYPPYTTRQAFMYEKLKNNGRAEDLYYNALVAMQKPANYWPYGYLTAKHLGDVRLKLADSMNRNAKKAIRDEYAQAAWAYRKALTLVLDAQGFNSVVSTPAANNLGMALLMKGERGDYEEAINILESLTQPQEAPPPSWYPLSPNAFDNVTPDLFGHNHALVPDEHNPIFRLNLGWAHELKGEFKKAEDQYIAAVNSHPSFHPALNDLGVLAATEEGNLDEAKRYFDAALDEKANYSHASFNLGVALMRSGGLSDYIAAQHYLARAVSLNPALSEARYDYIFDNELYFINLSLSEGVPRNWEFSKEARNGMGVASLMVWILILGRIALRFVGSEFREFIVERSVSGAGRFGSSVRLPGVVSRLRDAARGFMSFGVPTNVGWRMTLLALLISVPAVVVVMGWSLLRSNSEARLVMLATLSYLALVSLLVHHAGHVLAAAWFRMRVWAAPWPAGIVQAVLMAALWGPAVPPMPVNVVEEAKRGEHERSLVYVAGPVANILFALFLFMLFLIFRIPLMRFGAILNLAAAAVTLLLLPPLDGAMVGGRGRYARTLVWVGWILAAASVAVYFSNKLYCDQIPGETCWGLND